MSLLNGAASFHYVQYLIIYNNLTMCNSATYVNIIVASTVDLYCAQHT